MKEITDFLNAIKEIGVPTLIVAFTFIWFTLVFPKIRKEEQEEKKKRAEIYAESNKTSFGELGKKIDKLIDEVLPKLPDSVLGIELMKTMISNQNKMMDICSQHGFILQTIEKEREKNHDPTKSN